MVEDDRAIRLDEFLPYPPDRVWRVLVDPDLLAKWLMPNDFKPVVGHRFTFQSRAVPATRFGGIVYCEVLELDPERLLRLSWADRGPEGYEHVVTWRLEPEGRGTRLFLDHEGFDPDNEFQQLARRIMGSGWRTWLFQRVVDVLEGVDPDARGAGAVSG